MSCMQSTSWCAACIANSYKPSQCDVPVRLLHAAIGRGWEVDWPALGNIKVTVTSHDTDLASAENEEDILGGNNRDRDHSSTYLPDCFNAGKCTSIFLVS